MSATNSLNTNKTGASWIARALHQKTGGGPGTPNWWIWLDGIAKDIVSVRPEITTGDVLRHPMPTMTTAHSCSARETVESIAAELIAGSATPTPTHPAQQLAPARAAINAARAASRWQQTTW